MVARIARSPFATVARPGDQPSPQALLPNVAAAVAFLATTDLAIPGVVLHPSEGVTVTSLMRDLSGGRAPRRLPRWVARAVIVAARAVGRWHRPTAANARRIELLWMGQAQGSSWLTEQGWRPPLSSRCWSELGSATRQHSGSSSSRGTS